MNQFKLNKERIKSYFMKSEQEAELLIDDADKTQKKLDEAANKLNKVSDGRIKRVFEDLSLMMSLVKDWVNKRYKKIPLKSIISILGAIIYFVTPIDAVPDFILALGYFDDAFIISIVLKQIDSDLKEYRNWKDSQEK